MTIARSPRSRSPRRWYRWGLLMLVVFGSGWLLIAVRGVMLPFVLSFILAYLLAPLVEAMVHFLKVRRVTAILIAYAVLGTVIALMAVYLIPILVQESVHLIKFVPTMASEVQRSYNYWSLRFHQQPMPLVVRSAIAGTGKHLQGELMTVMKDVIHAIFGLVPGVLSIVIAPVLAFYVLKDLARIRERFWALIPINWHKEVFKLGNDIDRALNGFIRGQLLVALVVGLLSTVWMVILGIPFALLIGAVAGITDVIPYVGPIAGAIPAILLGLTRSPWVALYAVVGFVVIHQLEGVVISPKLVGESVGLHPLVVIFAILAGGEVAGFVGLLLGVPLAAVVRVLLSHFYRWFTVPLDHDSQPSVQ